MAAIYSNGGNRWNILSFSFTKRDALSSVDKIYMVTSLSEAFLLLLLPTLVQIIQLALYHLSINKILGL